MRGRTTLVAVAALTLMAAGAAVLLHLKATQRLGEPGVKCIPRENDSRLEIQLPQQVLDYDSTPIEPAPEELAVLPQDTSLARRLYRAPDNFKILLGVVLMGTDRTSIHKPEFCLPSQGWQIVEKGMLEIPIQRPQAYALPVGKFITRRLASRPGGGSVTLSGVYLFWFVAEDRITASHWGRMGWITWDLLRRGVLPRWAYLSVFVECLPGQEEAAVARASSFIAAAVPEFQRAIGEPAAVPGSGNSRAR